MAIVAMYPRHFPEVHDVRIVAAEEAGHGQFPLQASDVPADQMTLSIITKDARVAAFGLNVYDVLRLKDQGSLHGSDHQTVRSKLHGPREEGYDLACSKRENNG